MPFISEKIYQTVYNEKDSVHLTSWPKYEDKKVDLKLNEEMDKVREIVSLGLRERDKVQIGLKWPLAKAKILGGEFKLNEEMQEIICAQLNVKKLEFKKGASDKKEVNVELDTKITIELEAEGYGRELSRIIQSFRKELGLNKSDEVETIVVTDGEFKKILETQREQIKNKTNSKEMKIITTSKETFKNKTDFKIKDKKGVLAIRY